jgi:hypothetical protein
MEGSKWREMNVSSNDLKVRQGTMLIPGRPPASLDPSLLPMGKMRIGLNDHMDGMEVLTDTTGEPIGSSDPCESNILSNGGCGPRHYSWFSQA